MRWRFAVRIGDRSAQAMIEGQDTLMGTYEAMNKRIYDALPTDPECQRLYMKWKREFRAIALTGRRESQAKMDEVSATYAELKMCLALEGVEIVVDSTS